MESKLRLEIKNCPIETTFKHIGKKWAINIIRDLFFGVKRFKDFLKNNPNLSSKVLSQRLRDLERDSIVEKIIISKTPLKIEYNLTTKGRALEKTLYEMVLFSMNNYSREVFKNPSRKISTKMINKIAKRELFKQN